MLNDNITFEKKEAKTFTLLKNDIYPAQLIDVNLEAKQKYQSTEMENVLSFEFAVLGGKDIEGKDARTRLLAKNFIPTFLYISTKKGKNWLYKIVEALINRELTQEEEANGITSKTINFLTGKQCRLLLEKGASKNDPNKSFSNIVNILPADSEYQPLSAEEKEQIKEYKANRVKPAEQQSVSNLTASIQELTPEELNEIEGGNDINVDNIPF